MLLRRITQHVKDQNWFAVALDFIIVIAGILIAFQITNWNEARLDRETEVTYLELLQRDLRTTVAEVENQIAHEKFQVKLANDAVPIIAEPPSQLRQKKLGMIMIRLTGRRTLRVNSPTFEDLQSSGRLGLISDPELRSAILRYFFGAERLEAVIDKNNAHFVDENFHRFIDDMSIGQWLWDEDVMGSAPPGFVTRILDQQKTRIDPGLQSVGGDRLMMPSDDPIWDIVKMHLGKRAMIAHANETVAEALRDETAALEEEIAAYLEARR